MNNVKLRLLLLRVVQQGKKTSRFKEIENDAEANLSQQLRDLLFYSAASQHHHMIQVTIIFSVAQAAGDVASCRQ